MKSSRNEKTDLYTSIDARFSILRKEEVADLREEEEEAIEKQERNKFHAIYRPTNREGILSSFPESEKSTLLPSLSEVGDIVINRERDSICAVLASTNDD